MLLMTVSQVIGIVTFCRTLSRCLRKREHKKSFHSVTEVFSVLFMYDNDINRDSNYETFDLLLFSNAILPQAIAQGQIEKFLITLLLRAIHRYEFIPQSLYRRLSSPTVL